jgi:hypothetical protein
MVYSVYTNANGGKFTVIGVVGEEENPVTGDKARAERRAAKEKEKELEFDPEDQEACQGYEDFLYKESGSKGCNPFNHTLKAQNPAELSEMVSERAKMCMKRFAHSYGPVSGLYGQTWWKCGLWRECDTCLNDRAVKYKDALEKALYKLHDTGQIIRMVELSQAEAIAMARQRPKSEYHRFPMMNGREMFFFIPQNEGEEEMGIKFYYNAEKDVIDWRVIVCTPAKKRVSGGLGITGKERDTENLTLIVQPRSVTDAPAKARIEANKVTMQETADLDPTPTKSDVEAAMELRLKKTDDYLKSKGYEVMRVQPRCMYIDLTEVDWQAQYHDIAITDYDQCDNYAHRTAKHSERVSLNDYDRLDKLEANRKGFYDFPAFARVETGVAIAV